MTPIYTAQLVSFTNKSPRSIMIFSYWIEQEQPDGKWIQVQLPYGTNGQFFTGRDTTKVQEIKYVTLDSVIQNKNIAPDETIMGWIFTTKPCFGMLRFGYKDTTDYVAIGKIEPIASNAWPTQKILISRPSEKFVDISPLQRDMEI